MIENEELCTAIQQVMLGQADDLGGGVYKKRLGKNLYRSIIVARGGQYWVYEFLFAKQNRANIGNDDLARLRKLAKAYEMLTARDVDDLTQNNKWVEMCHDIKT